MVESARTSFKKTGEAAIKGGQGIRHIVDGLERNLQTNPDSIPVCRESMEKARQVAGEVSSVTRDARLLPPSEAGDRRDLLDVTSGECLEFIQ